MANILTLDETFNLANVSRPQTFSMGIRPEDIGQFLGFDLYCSNDTGILKFLLATLEYGRITDK